MDVQIPLTTLRGNLKSVSDLGPVFDFFFPRFFSLQQRGEHLKAAGVRYVFSSHGNELVGRGRERRFAGDETLPRSRYYALEDSPSNDPSNNTLLAEIFAYADPLVRVIPSMLDSTVDTREIEHWKQHGLDLHAPSLVQIVPPHRYGDIPVTYGFDFEMCELIVYPLNLLSVEIEGVLDLRYPAALDWLAHAFVPMEKEAEQRGKYKFRKSGAPETGMELLPTLLSQELGGGSPFIQGIGSWLRSHGVKGIVYPSARSDAYVEIKNNKIVRSQGFIFLDYRGATPSPWKDWFGNLGRWVDKNGASLIEVDYEVGPTNCIWQTRNVLQLQKQRFGAERQRFWTILERATAGLASGVNFLSDEVNLEGDGILAQTNWIGLRIGQFLASVIPFDPRDGFGKWSWDGQSWFLCRQTSEKSELRLRCPSCGFEVDCPASFTGKVGACAACGFSNSPLVFAKGNHWFLERKRPGTSIIRDIKCPRCGTENTWHCREDFPPRTCGKCGGS